MVDICSRADKSHLVVETPTVCLCIDSPSSPTNASFELVYYLYRGEN